MCLIPLSLVVVIVKLFFFILKRNVITHIHPIDAYTKSQLLGLIGSDKDDPINGVNPKSAYDQKKKKKKKFKFH